LHLLQMCHGMQQTSYLGMLAVSLWKLCFSCCKECELSTILSSLVNSLNNGVRMNQYSFLGRTAVSVRLNTTFRGLAPSPSSGKTDLYSNELTRLCAR
jgi:hypothetical protein